jgi:ABC-type transport system substrate-binding protein
MPGRSLSVTAFAGHVRGRPYLDRVQLVALPDAEAARSDVQAGRLDMGPGSGGPSALAATLLLVLDASRAPFDRPEARAAVAAALDRVDLVRHFLPGGDPAASLLPSTLLPPLGLESQPAPGSVSGNVAMIVDRDVPPTVSQRVSAVLGGLGLKLSVTPVAAPSARATPAPIRLLLWSPEVAEAGLALEELAQLAAVPDEARTLLAAAQHEMNLDRRRVLLHRTEATLRSGATLVPLASTTVSFIARRGVHGARVDLGARLRLEDAWLEP